MKRQKANNTEIAAFCRELALLIHAGVTAGDGLTLLAEEEERPGDKAWLAKMAEELDEGAPLAAAMEHTGRFPTYVTGLVEVGDRSGRTEEALEALSSYYEERGRMESRIKNALLYPAVLLVLMLVVIVVLLTKVMPVFSSVYASLGGRLTGAAGLLLQVGAVLDMLLPFLCVLLGLVCLFLLAFSLSEGFRNKILTFWRRHWGDKGVSRQINDARLAQAMAMGLASGLPVEEALELAGELMREVPEAAARCRDCGARLEQNSGDLVCAMRESRLLPPASCRLLALANRSGTADVVMAGVAERLSFEADEALARKAAQVEPALVLVTSFVVGAILLSVMLPLMNIMTAIG